MLQKEVDIVLCIPGPWSDRNELVEKVVKDSGGYIFAGMVLMNLETKAGFTLEFEGADERMLPAFEAAGPRWKDAPEMDRIATHKSIVYLSSKGGSINAVHSIMEAANGLLKAGGYGVKVESAGAAHLPQDWQEYTQYNYLFRSHAAFVVYIAAEYSYSCGMHNFGLPEAMIKSSESENPSELLRDFTFYVLSESPDLKSGQTFATDADSPVYRLAEHPGIHYDAESLYNNPFGAWQLQAI